MNHSPTPSAQPAGAGQLDHFNKHLRATLGVFVTLLLLLAVTVAVSYARLDRPWNIIVALVIAAIQAGLSAGVLMHLRAEKRLIFLLLTVTAVFFAGLMFLTLGSFANAVTPANVP